MSFANSTVAIPRLFGLSCSAASVLLLASCGGGRSNESAHQGDPTLTLYAPQTLDRVELEIDDPMTASTATFTFTALARLDPEQETGTFTYSNASTGDSFADEIVNGTYRYSLISGNEAILTFTGGTGTATTETATRFVRENLNGISLPLDFTNNFGFRTRVVLVTLNPFPLETTSGRVLVDGVPLPLNYNGSNVDSGEENLIHPLVQLALHQAEYVFTDTMGRNRVLNFTRTGNIGAIETGIFFEDPVPEPVDEDDEEVDPLVGNYSYQPDLSGGNASFLILSPFGAAPPITLTLEFLPGMQGTSTSFDEPFDGFFPLPFSFQ